MKHNKHMFELCSVKLENQLKSKNRSNDLGKNNSKQLAFSNYTQLIVLFFVWSYNLVIVGKYCNKFVHIIILNVKQITQIREYTEVDS